MISNNVLTACAALLTCCGLAACSREDAPSPGATQVETSGKEALDLEAAPAEVLAAARLARPGIEVRSVEHELRNGAHYYDVAGMFEGEEIELDITTVDERWQVVEVQRDVQMESVPEPVRRSLQAHSPQFSVKRIIESDQGDGVVIYEFFGDTADRRDLKIEIRHEGGEARVLESEWIH